MRCRIAPLGHSVEHTASGGSSVLVIRFTGALAQQRVSEHFRFVPERGSPICALIGDTL